MMNAFVTTKPSNVKPILNSLNQWFINGGQALSIWEINTVLYCLQYAQKELNVIDEEDLNQACQKASEIFEKKLISMKPKQACSVLCCLVECSPSPVKFEEVFTLRCHEILSSLKKHEICQVMMDFCDARVSIKRIYHTCATLGPEFPDTFDFEQRCHLLSVFETVSVPAPPSLLRAKPIRDQYGNPLIHRFKKLYDLEMR